MSDFHEEIITQIGNVLDYMGVEKSVHAGHFSLPDMRIGDDDGSVGYAASIAVDSENNVRMILGRGGDARSWSNVGGEELSEALEFLAEKLHAAKEGRLDYTRVQPMGLYA